MTTVAILCPSLAIGLYAVYVPGSAFGAALGGRNQDLGEAVEPGMLYAASSALIIGIPMVAVTCPIFGRIILLPDWGLQVVRLVDCAMIIVYGMLLQWGFLGLMLPHARETLGYNASQFLGVYTAVILGMGLFLVRGGSRSHARSKRYRNKLLIIVPVMPALTAAILLGVACLLPEAEAG